MKTGFTGTQLGMTAAQKRIVETFLRNSRGEFQHGDCIGADEEAHEIALGFGFLIILHPPTNRTKRAFCDAAIERMAKPYLSRNKDIVLETDQLIAAPGEEEEHIRSGTWSTVRFARSLKRTINIVLPDGRVLVENAVVPVAQAETGG